MLLIGTGFGVAMPALMTLGMSGATASDSGLASALFNTSQQIGGALGPAVLSVLAAARYHRLAAGGLAAVPALTGGYHLAFQGAACFAAAAPVVAATVLRRQPGSRGEGPAPLRRRPARR